jgi:transcriptional regulator with XRE-family HTH domain
VTAETFYDEVGRRIYAARVGRGLTQREAADAAGLDPPVLCRIENGRYRCNLRQFLALRRVFGELALPDVPHPAPVALASDAGA